MADQKVSDLPSLNGADVDPADLLYIVDSSAGAAGSKKITVGQYQVAPYSAGTANGVMYLNGSNVVTTGAGLTFDGTNLGIGTSSPGAKLEVASGKVLLSNAQSYAIKAAAGASCDVVSLTSGNVLQLGGGGATDSIQFWNQGLERMRLDASGNLGLGVTPSAWTGSGGKNIELGATGNALFGSVSLTTYTSNANFDSSWKYSRTGFASRYEQQNSVHAWYNAPSGTAGNAISFTQAMTLDASGRLLVGGTSALYSEKFGITATGTTSVPTSLSALNGALALISTGQASTAYGGVGYQDSGGGGAAVVFGRGTGFDTQILFCTNPGSTTTSGAMTERARIDSSGNLLVGLTSAATWNTGAEGGKFQIDGNRPCIITEIGGNISFRGNSGGWAMGMYAVGSSNTARGGFGFTGSADTLSNYWVGTAYNGTGVSLSYGGTSWTTLSDARDKNVHGEIEDALTKINSIRGVYYNYKTDDQQRCQRVGFIAQEVKSVLPEAVEEQQRDIDNPTEDTKRFVLSYTELIPLLLNGIKEQQALITDLRARVAALEAQ